MKQDKIYIDSNNKSTVIEIPQFGEIKLIVQNGKVIRTETTASQKIE